MIKKQEEDLPNGFIFIVCLMIFILMGVLALSTKSMIKDMTIDSANNSFKNRIYYEGKEAYIHYLENNKIFNNDYLKNVSPNSGDYANIDLDWVYDKQNNYIVLSKNSKSMTEFSQKLSKFDFNLYRSLCGFIQDGNTASQYIEYKEPVQKKSNNITQNLDCIYDDNEFKIIYLLDKRFEKRK